MNTNEIDAMFEYIWGTFPKVYRILTEEEYYEANLEYEEWLAEQYLKSREEN